MIRIASRFARIGLATIAVAALLFAGAGTRADAANVEPWADANLKTTDGLVVWFDAAKLPEARAARGPSATKAGDAVDLWPDASGGKRDVVQGEPGARPTYEEIDELRAVRFDGTDDYLGAVGLDRSFERGTVFVVAAPYSCPVWFSAFVAYSEEGKNDFQTGLNVDQAAGGPQRFEVLNVEGAGCQGMTNLLKTPAPYGSLLRMCVESSPGENGCRLRVNGQPQGQRPRQDGTTLAMDRLVLGGRYYGHGTPPFVRDFLDGVVAEILIYDRSLADQERDDVEKYLEAKYGAVDPLPVPKGARDGVPLIRVENPPPVQALVPGFAARRLPIEIANVNNVLYRPDGKLVALCYDGDVWLLSDTDGDGLEDRKERFWDNQGRLRVPIGMALTPPGYPRGKGVFVASKGKCSLLTDADGDGVAETETVAAEGWPELQHNVDVLGIDVDPRDGSVYFGLGTQDYTDPYAAKKDPNAVYPLDSERGTILRAAPDFKSWRIFATGIRFPVAIRFNAAGDLFCTDQEGATWVPNGNPFDELLHVQEGRHYGFPARHPKHLPDVIDEPSVFDYVPQHQSTCGLNFNEPVVPGGPVFGPAWWKSDAIVAGYSRGKLYRTALVSTPAGYVARTNLFACFDKLVSDACISPTGDLVVACHSGAPDWGSGPTGEGTLYKLVRSQPELPQPVFVWPQTPREVRVAFDQPLSAEQLAGVQSGARIEYGAFVAPGDRFESLWPGYQVVREQQRTPRYELLIHSVQVTADGRTLILATDPHPQQVPFALTLAGLGRTSAADASLGESPQIPETDLGYDLSGVDATWTSTQGEPAWSGWLPHLDLAVAKSFTQGSVDHDLFWERSRAPGELTLKTTLDVSDLLRPAVQPGSKIDFEWPAEEAVLTFRSKAPLRVRAAGHDAQPLESERARFVATVRLPATKRAPIEIVLPTTPDGVDLQVTWSTAEDSRERTLPLRRLLVPWAPESRDAGIALASAADVPELKGGNWERGRATFFSETALCSKCHAVRGEGGAIGPDLSNLPHRDYASVMRDLTEPSFAVNPDFVSHVVALADGRVLTGSLRTDGDRLLLGDPKGQVTVVARADVETMKPSRLSIMPEGLPKTLGPEKTRDLLTFLLTDPPRMPDYGTGKPPEPRSREEVERILAGGASPPEETRDLRIVLVTGPKDHGPGEHDYPAWQTAWSRLLGMAEKTTVETADDWPSAEQFERADVLVLYQQGKWTPERAKDMDAFLARGGGAIYIHYAVDGGADAPGFAQRIGLAWQGGQSKFRHGPLDLGFDPAEGHPIARNLDEVHFHDESYWNLVGDPKRISLLATGDEEGAPQPLFWTMQPAEGRVFVSIPGHFAWTFDDPVFRVLLLRGIAWTGKEPVDRFDALVWPGARIAEPAQRPAP